MTFSRSFSETALYEAIGQIMRAGVTDANALLALPELYQCLIQAVRTWATDVGSQQDTVRKISCRIGRDMDSLVEHFTEYVFRPEGCTGAAYPTLNRLLSFARRDGADSAELYLMRVMHSQALLLYEEYQRRVSKLRVVYSFTHSEALGEPDPREVWDDASYDAEAVRNVLSELGRSREVFLSDLLILADAVGCSRELVADFLFKGKQKELITAAAGTLRRAVRQDFTAVLRPLQRRARTFVLPEPFREDCDALLDFLSHQEQGTALSRLAQRRQTGE